MNACCQCEAFVCQPFSDVAKIEYYFLFSKHLIIKSLKKRFPVQGANLYIDRFAPCTGRMLHQSYSIAVHLNTAVYVRQFPFLFAEPKKHGVVHV